MERCPKRLPNLLSAIQRIAENLLGISVFRLDAKNIYLVKAVKHEKPVNFENKTPFFITTNEMPYFGNEDENLRQRVAIFKTKALPTCISNVDRCLRENAMECVAWMTEEIERERHHISKKELWYEEACSAETGLPRRIVIHCSTNDISSGTAPNEVAEEIVDLATNLKSHENEVFVSSIVARGDRWNERVSQVNNVLKAK